MKQKLKKKKIKKKGFTLVELLAVIVILAIIMVITVPTVLGSISEAKKSAFNTVGETMKKYLKDNYNNCKLNIGNLASYDKEIFNEQCQIRTEKNPEDLSRALIKNSGYSTKDIEEVQFSKNEESFGVVVIPSAEGQFSKFDTYIEGTYEGDCWTIESIDNGEYKFTEFHGIDKETGEITESCGVTKEDEEYTITIPSNYNGVSITTLGSKLFYERYDKENAVYHNIKKIEISEGITTIEEGKMEYDSEERAYFPTGTFANVGRSHVLNVKLPNTLTKIGKYAFTLTGLQAITIPSSVKEIGERAFEENQFLYEVIFEGAEDETSQLTLIGDYAFAGIGVVERIVIPSSVEIMPDNVFAWSLVGEVVYK